MFKVLKRLTSDIFLGVFNTRNKANCNLCQVSSHFDVPLINSVYNGTEIIPFFETQNLRYITQLDKREKNRGNIIGAIKMGTGKLPMWTLQVLFKWTRIYLRHTCI